MQGIAGIPGEGGAAMKIEIPGYRELNITSLLLDYNGTIAVDGVIRREVRERIGKLAKQLDI